MFEAAEEKPESWWLRLGPLEAAPDSYVKEKSN